MADPHHYLWLLRPSRPQMLKEGFTPQEANAVEAHFGYLKHLTELGHLVLAGRTVPSDESAFGVVVLRVPSEEAARALAMDDPAVRGGVMRVELFPFRLALLDLAGRHAA